MEMEYVELTYKRPAKAQPLSVGGYYYGYDNWDWELAKPKSEPPEPKLKTKVTWSKEIAQEFGVEYYGSTGNNNNNVQKAG
jgi:hypothetical protein